jgi:nucleotide-binding universal stress UspA family protein
MTALAGLRDLSPDQPVVVGVDGSPSSRAAVQYAVTDAAACHRPLLLVASVDDPSHLVPDPYPDAERGRDLLSRISREAEDAHPGLRVRRTVESGNTVECLLQQSRRADRLVVGRRGLGTFSRMMLGSTSLGVAARSGRPVVVVPTGWRQADHEGLRVVVGAELGDPMSVALRFAFEEAQRRGAALDVVHAIDIEPVLVWDPVLAGPTYRHWEARGRKRLEDVVEPLRAEFPSVEVRLFDERGNAATVLLERSHDAGLLVLGRRHRGPLGLSLGSTARAVLHYAAVPVAVVPWDRLRRVDPKG